MKYILPILVMVPWMAAAEPKSVIPYIASCLVQDTLEIVDDGQNSAIVTYMNSGENCSSNVSAVITAPNGIAVKIVITIGDAANDRKERIELYPMDDYLMSFPPEGYLIDGETMEFQIMGGLA